METNTVYVLSLITANQAEIEGMKLQNEIDKQAGRELTYKPEDFFNKTLEVQENGARLFK